MDQTKPFIIPLSPFKIVHERPAEVSFHRHTVGSSPAIFAKVTMEKIYALGIMHFAVETHPIHTGQAVFRNNDRQAISLMEQLRTPI
ncbi:hypothetical protein D3C75_911880 [compost metagenome]